MHFADRGIVEAHGTADTVDPIRRDAGTVMDERIHMGMRNPDLARQPASASIEARQLNIEQSAKNASVIGLIGN